MPFYICFFELHKIEKIIFSKFKIQMNPLFTATKEADLNNLTPKIILKKSLTPVVDHNKRLNNKLTT